MKFITIFIALIALLAIVSTRRANSRSTYNTKVVPGRTANTDAKGGLIYYLDRQTVGCSYGQGLSYFKLNAPGGDKVYYDTACIGSLAISMKQSEIRKDTTTFSGYNTGYFQDFSVNFLDRHAVMCRSGEILKTFKMERDSAKKNIQYKYECVKAQTLCCKDHTTAHTSMKSRKTFDLQNQKVGDASTATTVLKGFKLWSSSPQDTLWYKYTTCKLKDMVADAKEKLLTKAYNTDSESLAKAVIEFNDLDKKVEDARKKVSDLEAEFSTASSHAGLTASC